ncbi:MAG: hypothetical protein ACE5OZ_19475 [Candidatus Heimdallarchaeota archaeon]
MAKELPLGVLAVDLGTSHVKMCVYSARTDTWEKVHAFRNKLYRVKESTIQEIKDAGGDVDVAPGLYTPYDIGVLKSKAEEVAVLEDAWTKEPDLLRVSYIHVCQQADEVYGLTAKENLYGGSLLRPDVRNKWGIFATVTQLKEDVSRTLLVDQHRQVAKDLNFAFFYSRPQTFLAIMANGADVKKRSPSGSCTVIDIGGGDTKGFCLLADKAGVVPLPETMVRQPLAGETIERRFMANLVPRAKGYKRPDKFLDHLYRYGRIKTLDESKSAFRSGEIPPIMLKSGSVALNVEDDDDFVPTMLFEPSKYGFHSEKGLHQIIWDMIESAEQLDVEPVQLLKCVLLVGGTCQYPYMDVRLKEEIDKLWPDLAPEMSVIRAKDAQLSVVNGQRLATRTIFRKHKEDGESFFKYFETLN